MSNTFTLQGFALLNNSTMDATSEVKYCPPFRSTFRVHPNFVWDLWLLIFSFMKFLWTIVGILSCLPLCCLSFVLWHWVFEQIVAIPIGTNCAQLLSTCILCLSSVYYLWIHLRYLQTFLEMIETQLYLFTLFAELRPLFYLSLLLHLRGREKSFCILDYYSILDFS